MTRTAEQIRAEKLFKKLCRKAGTTIRDHAMLEEGDRVLVGLSGGKDSMVLLKALSERRDAMPVDFTIEAAHVEATGIGYRIDSERLTGFCEDLGIPLHYREIAPDLKKDPSKAACFVCSWERRKKLFALTRELGSNKLALGHHRIDAVETLLMNMIFHGSISSLPYSLKMFDGRVRLIRPLLDLEEGLIEEYATLSGVTGMEKGCPHEDKTRRARIAGLIRQIEAIHGPGPYNIFKSMGKVLNEYLPGKGR
jgi:tRNA 2-thiocytidine biosynthesis protein TtcA